ncbi:E3 SUMO-protein ligase ZBED1 [Drosophila takahashii]|uniref:E3 SUMO-protein ligase ZBED1 n=1 Tax=Drosophila takahashii TaxID=29030 RepID=UPI001CF8ACF7|nr:E3 SUMO-protein ligase ZBED1 [Drosophila takahashii]
MSRSKIWKYYDKLDRNSALCQLCEKVIKTCGNTSNLMKHMKTHPQVDLFDDETVVVRGIYKRRDQDDHKRRLRKVLPFKEESSDFHSELLFKAAKDAGDIIEMEAQGLTKTTLEDHISVQSVGYAWVTPEAAISGTETVSAEDIIEYEPKEETEEPDRNAIHQDVTVPEANNLKEESPLPNLRSFHQDMAFFICRDRQPLQVLQGEGFQHLMKVLCPTYKPPSVTDLEAIIGRESELQRSKLRHQLNKTSTLSLSCSMHTNSAGQSWLELVAHFQEGRQRISRTLSVQSLPDPLTSSQVVERLERVCQRFDILKSKITCVTTRSCSLLEEAVSLFLGAEHHVLCFADQLEALLEAVLLRPEIRGLCEKVRRYVEATLEAGVHKLQLDNIKRPFSSYEMLEMYLKHSAIHLEESLPLSPAETDLCQQLLDVLRPLTSSMRELSRTEYPAASTALPIAHTLINELKQEKSAEHKVIQELRLFMVQHMVNNFEEMEANLHVSMATLLDPRFRNIPFQSGALVAKYMTQLYDWMQAHVDSGEAIVGEDPVAQDNFDIWAAYKSFSHEKQRLINGTNGPDADDEIATYFCASISTLQADPCRIWQELAAAHPFLHSVAQRYLHIPATAESPSRLFTAEGAAVTEKYASLLEKNMENVLFMADVPTKDWNL